MTPLRVAACPVCQGAVVFGERACRACGQAFDYGPAGPPVPTPALIVEALAAVGLAPAATAAMDAPLQGLERSRYEDAGDVDAPEVTGFMATAMFAAFTPAHVEVEPVLDLEAGRFTAVADLGSAPPEGLERTAQKDGGASLVTPVSGLFGSDLDSTAHVATAHVSVAALPVDGLEASPCVPRRKRPQDKSLERSPCRCGKVHCLAVCPECGMPRPR